MASKRLGIALAVVLGASVLIAALLWLNISRLTRRFAEQRIPGLTLGEAGVGWNRVRISDFRYTFGDSLVISVDARAVDAYPTFLSFLDEQIEVRNLVIRAPGFRLIRQPRAKAQEPGPATTSQADARARARFRSIRLARGQGEIEDRTVNGPPARLLLEQIEVRLEDVTYPAAAGPTSVEAACLIRGQPDGKARLVGWMDPVNQSAELRAEVANLDFRNLKPYLRNGVPEIEDADGIVDLRLDLVMSNGAYTATGELTLTSLEVPHKEHPSLATRLLAGYLKLHKNRVAIPFKITGDVKSKEHRLDLSAELSGVIKQEIGSEALQKKVGLPRNPGSLDKDLRRLQERAKELKKLF